jgi:hypothetical protein
VNKTLPKLTWREITRVIKHAGGVLLERFEKVQVWLLEGKLFTVPSDRMNQRAPNSFCDAVYNFIASLAPRTDIFSMDRRDLLWSS